MAPGFADGYRHAKMPNRNCSSCCVSFLGALRKQIGSWRSTLAHTFPNLKTKHFNGRPRNFLPGCSSETPPRPVFLDSSLWDFWFRSVLDTPASHIITRARGLLGRSTWGCLPVGETRRSTCESNRCGQCMAASGFRVSAGCF